MEIQILLVESDPVLRDLIKLALENPRADGRGMHAATCRVTSASEPAQAIAACQQARPHLLILDFLLPQSDGLGSMNGLDLVELLRKNQLLAPACMPSAPVIMLSALGYREIVQQAVDAGVFAYLVKPIDMALLGSRVEAALKKIQS